MAKILIVDDDEMLTDMLVLMLATKGYQVTVANSGEEALKMVNADAPDLMLLDMNIPEMDGMGILRSLNGLQRKFPVILLSGMDDPKLIRDAMMMGVASHCTKPFKAAELYGAVSNCLMDCED